MVLPLFDLRWHSYRTRVNEAQASSQTTTSSKGGAMNDSIDSAIYALSTLRDWVRDYPDPVARKIAAGGCVVSIEQHGNAVRQHFGMQEYSLGQIPVSPLNRLAGYIHRRGGLWQIFRNGRTVMIAFADEIDIRVWDIPTGQHG